MQTYFRIIQYGKAYFGLGIVAISCLLIYTLFNTVSLVAIIPFLEILFKQGELEAPTIALDWFNVSSVKEHAYFQLSQAIEQFGPQQMLLYFSLVLVGSIVLKNAAKYFSSYFMAPFEQGIMENLRNRLFRHLMIQDMAFFTGQKKGNS